MIDPDDLKLYLPKYLSPETEQKLLDDLCSFPQNMDQRIYGFIGKELMVVYQGDAIKKLPFINLPEERIENLDSVIISNTCDNDVRNVRKFNTNILYSPLFSLDKYKQMLIKRRKMNIASIEGHIEEIRRQRITQIFYFPIGPGIDEEKIIFFDKICNCQRNFLENRNIDQLRLFSLSQYGFYLFLYKLSIHFTRFHENVDRVY